MEVVVIDKATFERMLSGFEIFAEKVERLCREQEDLGEKEWLDSDDVCRLLCISPRTLQTMRENGTLAYTKISHKVYYRPEDVKSIFPVTEMKRCITAGKERKCNVSNKQTNKPTNKPTNKQISELMNDNGNIRLLTPENDMRVRAFLSSLEELSEKVEKIRENNKPSLDGERYYTDKELAVRLKVSRRSLQDYRNNGILPYIQIGGRILYRASDIERTLMDGYKEAYHQNGRTRF